MDQPPARQSLLGLKALVGIMAVLIVVGTTLVVGVIIHRLYARTEAPSIEGTTAAPSIEGTAVAPSIEGPAALPSGSRIMGIAAAGDFVAVWVSGAGGDAVWLLDPRTGTRRIAMTAPR